jgi:hypothetical protein
MAVSGVRHAPICFASGPGSVAAVVNHRLAPFLDCSGGIVVRKRQTHSWSVPFSCNTFKLVRKPARGQASHRVLEAQSGAVRCPVNYSDAIGAGSCQIDFVCGWFQSKSLWPAFKWYRRGNRLTPGR